MQGAIGGGLAGFQSPGIGKVGEFGRTKIPFGDIFKSKVDPVSFLGEEGIFSGPGAKRFFFGGDEGRGLFGEFDFAKGDTEVFKTIKFRFNRPIKEDESIIKFIQHLEKQPTADWGFGEKLLEKTVESLARESHEETQMH